MLEYGIDIGNQKVKRATENMIWDATIVICIESEHDQSETSTSKMVKCKIREITDNSLDEIREIRDEIEKKVRGLAADLNKKNF